jgi:hypothetical protein
MKIILYNRDGFEIINQNENHEKLEKNPAFSGNCIVFFNPYKSLYLE